MISKAVFGFAQTIYQYVCRIFGLIILLDITECYEKKPVSDFQPIITFVMSNFVLRAGVGYRVGIWGWV